MILKNERLKTYTVISWLMILLNFVSFVYIGVSGTSNISNLPYFSAGLLLVIYLFRFASSREAFENDSIILCFLIAMISWVFIGFYWAAVIMLFLFLFQDVSRRKLTVLFFDDRIVYPSFPRGHRG